MYPVKLPDLTWLCVMLELPATTTPPVGLTNVCPTVVLLDPKGGRVVPVAISTTLLVTTLFGVAELVTVVEVPRA